MFPIVDSLVLTPKSRLIIDALELIQTKSYEMAAILKNVRCLVRVQYVCIIVHIAVEQEGLPSTFRPHNY